MLNRAQLPDNIDALKALLSAKSAQIDAFEQERAAWQVEREALRQDKQGDKHEIARLTLLLDKLRRALFGQKSEKLIAQIDQLQLELEELHINQGERAQKVESAQAPASRPAPQRRPLPEHLPCDVHEHLPKESVCPDCGGAWTRLGEDVSNVLDTCRPALESFATCVHAWRAVVASGWRKRPRPAAPLPAASRGRGC